MKLYLPRFQASQTKLNLILALYFATILNYALYAKTLQLHPFQGETGDYFIFTIPLFIYCGCLLIFTLLAQPIVHKIIVPALLLISAAVSYSAIFLDVYFNRDMLTNVLITTASESAKLITPSFIAWFTAFGILPTALYLRTQIQYRSLWREILQRLATAAAAIAGIGIIAAFFYQDYASFGRNNPTIKDLIIPSNFIGAGISQYKHYRRSQIPYQVLDPKIRQRKPDNHTHVIVLIVGEATRAANWGLNGYARQTTPKLAARGDSIFNFNNVTSCNTFTAGSLPCMFSPTPRADFDPIRAAKQDTLLDVLQRAGIQITWIDNDTGCKGVCSNIPFINVTEQNNPQYCKNGECRDEAMLPELDKALAQAAASQKDSLIIVHTIGSHDPTYSERYTPAQRLFTPTCDTNEINRCTQQELINTYDNTVVSVDGFIDAVISRVEQHQNWESAVLYVSDHGESLGEKGVYLHSTPYAIAPKEQTHVPMIMWFSPLWHKNEGMDAACLRRNAQTQAYSHDNFYSTVFGTLDMDSTTSQTYRPELDILASCRKLKT